MKIDEFMNLIGYSQTAIETYYKMQVQMEEYLLAKNLYYADEDKFLQQLKDKMQENYYPALLFYFTNFALDLYPHYLEEGFTKQEFLDTFYDLKIWNEMCILETGICGLRETGWLTSHMHAGIVRLGRLQFQTDEVEEDIILKDRVIKAGTPILNVHIPFGGVMSEEEVNKSFARAKAHYGEKYVHIESWLLDPTLKNYLPKNSNILSFANRFELYKKEESNSIERFVFRVIKENKEEYIANSSFAKTIKQELLKGTKFYSGYAITTTNG